MRGAKEASERNAREELALSACMVLLMEEELAWRKSSGKKEPENARAAVHASRSGLDELIAKVDDPDIDSEQLRTFGSLKPLLGGIESTIKDCGLLVELCAFQPWAMTKQKRKAQLLKKEPRSDFLERTAMMLGGNTTPKDVEIIDKVLYPRSIVKIAVIGGAAIGFMVFGWWLAWAAAPMIGGAIGGAMGLSGAAAVNAGLAAVGGGSLAAGGLGMAGGTMIIGGMGALVGGATAAGGTAFITSQDVSPAALKAHANKLRALHDCLELHGQESQAYAQQMVVKLRAEIEALSTEITRLKRQALRDKEQLHDLEEKFDILSEALGKMEHTSA